LKGGNVVAGDAIEIMNEDILVVDDTPENLKLLVHALSRAGYRVRPVSNGELALRSINAKLPALILMDVRMPGIDGYEVCRRLKADEKTRSIPIIFISAIESEGDIVIGFQAGGVDYITKPFHLEEVLARINTHLSLRRLHLELEMKNRALAEEITAHMHAELELKRLSIHDPLTGLYNRAFFEEELSRLERGRQYPVSILMMDVDNLKGTNDQDGHAAGDALLKRVAEILVATFRADDIIVRIGGDEFAVLLPCTNVTAAEGALMRARRNLQENNARHTGTPVGLSFGVSTAEKGMSLSVTLKKADQAMYCEKREHRTNGPG
jgi:diguanylate cyclase (GGDEF)-like protein